MNSKVKPSIIKTGTTVTVANTTKGVIVVAIKNSSTSELYGVAVGKSYKTAKRILAKAKYSITPNIVFAKHTKILSDYDNISELCDAKLIDSFISIISVADENTGERRLIFRLDISKITLNTIAIEGYLSGQELIDLEHMLEDITRNRTNKIFR